MDPNITQRLRESQRKRDPLAEKIKHEGDGNKEKREPSAATHQHVNDLSKRRRRHVVLGQYSNQTQFSSQHKKCKWITSQKEVVDFEMTIARTWREEKQQQFSCRVFVYSGIAAAKFSFAYLIRVCL